jgi:hypothetical protein
MEINYNLIIKYLSNNKVVENTFENQKNIMVFGDKFPTEFKNLLADKFYRLGVTQKYENKNISFYTSLLTLLDENILTMTEKEELNQVNSMKSEILNKMIKLPDHLKEISKGALKKYVTDLESNIWVLELVVNYLKINLLIFDFKNLEIYSVYGGEVMDPWRSSLLLAKYENNWEPIRNNEKKVFSYNDLYLKKILSQNSIEIKYFDGAIIKKDFVMMDNLNEVVNEMLDDNNDSSESDSDSDKTTPFIKKEQKFSESKLNKMTKNELLEHLKLLNLKASNKSTKKDLVQLIMQS